MARKGQGKKTVRHFTAQEVAAIRATLLDRPRDLSLFDVGVHLGLRGGDLLALAWSQVLNRALTDIADSMRITEQKTKRTAVFPISPPIRQALHRWWQLRGEPTDGPVWPSRKGGGVMRVGYLHHLVNRWADAAKVEGHFGSHSIRKSFGRAFLAQGGTVPQLAHRFGHHSTSTTRAYLGLDDEEVNEIAGAVDLTAPPKSESEPSRPKRKGRVVRQGAFVTNIACASPRLVDRLRTGGQGTPQQIDQDKRNTRANGDGELDTLREEVAVLRQVVAGQETTIRQLNHLLSIRQAAES